MSVGWRLLGLIALLLILTASCACASTDEARPRNVDKVDWWTTAPHLASIGFDGYTTERSLALDGHLGWRVREGNPLPGMQTSAGRAAWATVEIASVQALGRRHQTWGRVAAWTLTVVHIGLGVHNWRDANRIRQWR